MARRDDPLKPTPLPDREPGSGFGRNLAIIVAVTLAIALVAWFLLSRR
jgi:hypothetical protein